jgi:hypothetical protein
MRIAGLAHGRASSAFITGSDGGSGGNRSPRRGRDAARSAAAEGRGAAERREIEICTAFRGPGGRDAFEMVTRAMTDGRYVVDPARERPERGDTLARYVFVLSYRGRTVRLQIRGAGARRVHRTRPQAGPSERKKLSSRA